MILRQMGFEIGNDPVEFENARAVTETRDAVLCQIKVKQGNELKNKLIWVPKSVIIPGSEIRGAHDRGVLIVKTWWVAKRRLF